MKNGYVTDITEIPMNGKHAYDFIKNKNNHYLAVTKPNALLTNFLSKHNSGNMII